MKKLYKYDNTADHFVIVAGVKKMAFTSATQEQLTSRADKVDAHTLRRVTDGATAVNVSTLLGLKELLASSSRKLAEPCGLLHVSFLFCCCIDTDSTDGSSSISLAATSSTDLAGFELFKGITLGDREHSR
jgi:predicted proteasome-type protease